MVKNIFILAGGFGTRLKEVVSDVPKPMASINNKPFLEYQIYEIRKYFPEVKIYLLTYYLSKIIEDYFKNDESIIIIKEKESLGTGGSIKNAIQSLNLGTNNSVMIFNGDTYIKPNLEEMIKNAKYDVTIVASKQNNCDRYGTLIINDNNSIVDFKEKEIGISDAYINAGCYYFKNLEFFKNIKEQNFAIEDRFKDYLLKDTIGVFRYNEVFIDIGIPEDYTKMIKYIEERL